MSNEILSNDDVKAIVTRAFPDEDHLDVLSYELVSHSKHRVGFLGEHQNLVVRLKCSDSSEQPEVHRFFVKTIPEVSEHQSLFIRHCALFNREADYFNILLPELRRGFAGPDWCPKCLLANERLVVLEDMRTREFAMLDDRILDAVHLRSAVRAQARLHAASLLAEARLRAPASELCPTACREVIYADTMSRSGRLELFAELVETFALRLGLEHRRIRPGFRRGLERLHEPDAVGRRVLSHGDAWPNNYLFDGSEPPECVLVDFQLVRYAPRMYDVAQLVYLGTEPGARRELEREAVEAYHEELCAVLDRNELADELERPSLEELLKEYEDVRCTVLLGAAIYYPIIGMTKKMLVKYEHNPDEIYEKIFLRVDNKFVLELCDEFDDYAKMLQDLAKEAVEFYEKIGVPLEENEGKINVSKNLL